MVVVISLIIISLIINGSGENIAAEAGKAIALRIAIGGAIGVAAGLFWLWILTLIEGETYDDILTLSVVLLLYFITESISGSGVIFAFIFGLILGNGVAFARWLHIRRTIEVHDLMRKFHAQISFLIKTFFFIYLGLMAIFDKPTVIVLGIVLSLVLLLARNFAVMLSSIGNKAMQNNMNILISMYPRGLSVAVVAQLIVASNIPNASTYSDIATVVIVTTIIISALGVLLFVKRLPEKNNHHGEEIIE
jgi:cell volume regulation protein A